MQRLSASPSFASGHISRGIFATLPALGIGQTYAKDKVWSGSAQNGVKFQPISRKERMTIWYEAVEMSRDRSRDCKTGGGRQGGTRDAKRSVMTGNALSVLRVLLFDFLNMRTGRLDPSYEGIAAKTGLSRATVARALVVLRKLGVIHWVRRCTGFIKEGRYMLEQLRNAYAILTPTSWRSHRPAEQPPAPTPDVWGAAPPPRQSIGDEALADLPAERTTAQIVRALQVDPDNPLMAALARLGANFK